ncbi:MAG: SurA N-terminal domain-containing protein [bacterium]|nr:SurA N-terminal domain-containing protein [bacterium]
MTQLKFLWLTLAALLLLSACETEEKTRVALIPEDETIAVVNNEKIHLSKFQARFQAYLKRYKHLIPAGEENKLVIKRIVIDQLINEELMAQEATRKGIQVSKEELETAAEEALSPYPNANFDRDLASANLTKKEWKERLQLQILLNKLVEQEVIKRIPVTKREINAYYKKHRRELVWPKAVRARNLTLATQAEAEALLSLLGRGGDIKDLIRRHSISPDRVNDGDLGFVERGEMPPEIEAAIFGLNYKNRLSGIVHSQDGYHIFYWLKSRNSQRMDVDEAKEEIKNILVAERQGEAYESWLKRLKEGATISVDERMLQTEEGF